MVTKSAGEEGYHWFFGVVEDRNDPQQLGRVRVRVINRHTSNTALLPTDQLPWATPLMPVTSAGAFEVGHSPTGLTVGSVVHGFFVDGEEAQVPMITHTLAGIPDIRGKPINDVSQLARGINNIVKQYVPNVEPHSTYNSKYPYNKTTTTEGGHAIEIDDTPSAERLHFFHKDGSYMEFSSQGQVVYKSVANTFQISVKDHVIFVGGDYTLATEGNAIFVVGGSAAISVKGDATVNIGGDVKATIGGKFTGKASEWDITGDIKLDGKLTATGDVKAGNISLEDHTHDKVQAGGDESGKPVG